ncbi:MAG: hypothetical protein M3N91_05190 [Pseudomonadota bacterium]|nr:hypothetical protein [Pseudomonadota bacterium]
MIENVSTGTYCTVLTMTGKTIITAGLTQLWVALLRGEWNFVTVSPEVIRPR